MTRARASTPRQQTDRRTVGIEPATSPAPGFEPLSPKSLQDQVYERLSDALMSGAFAPGEPLLVVALAKSFDVSLMPVRDAVRRLHFEGVLQIEPQKGMRVRLLSRLEFEDLIKLRLCVEPDLAAAAVARITDAGVARVAAAGQSLLDAFGRSDYQGAARTNKELRFALYEYANRPISMQVIRTLWTRMGPFIRVYNIDPAFQTGTGAAEIERLGQALKSRDSIATARWVREAIKQPAATLLADFERLVSHQAEPHTGLRRSAKRH